MPETLATASRPREIEAVPTTLARIEGTVNLVAHDVIGLANRLTAVEIEVRSLEILTQRLDLDAENRDRIVTSTALVIKTEKENAAQILATEKVKAESSWSPFAKSAIILNAAVAIVVVWYQMNPHH